MPIHDWSRVDASIFHAFHHSWIEEIARALNRGLLPAEYYALVEQHTADSGPDVLTLQESRDSDADAPPPPASAVVVRHMSGDRIVTTLKVISPGNKASRHTLRARVESRLSIRAYVVHAAVGDALPGLPLFLEPEKAIDAPLEATYNAAFAEVPRRWRRVLEAPPAAD